MDSLSFKKLLAWVLAFVLFSSYVFASPLERRSTCIPSETGSPSNLNPTNGGTYPRAKRLQDGSLIASLTTFGGGNNTLTLVRSTDNGDSWQPLHDAATKPSQDSIDNAYPLPLPSGKIVLAFRNHDGCPTPDKCNYYRITLVSSEDQGKSWTYLSTPAENPGPDQGLWEPFMRTTTDGKLQLYYSKEKPNNDQVIIMQTSTDEGQTWSAQQTVISHSGKRDGMIAVAPISGSNLIAVFESHVNDHFDVHAVFSSDDGASWDSSSDVEVYSATGTDNNAGSPYVVNVGGALIASFMTDEDTSEHNWPQGAGTKVVTSTDSGKTWGNKMGVGSPESNWPGMMVLDDKTALLMYENGSPRGQKVAMSGTS